MHEDKEAIVTALLETLKLTRSGCDIVGMSYKRASGHETVVVTYGNSYEKQINVTCDSGIALIQDVCRHL